jgi:hypothetical protein
MDRVSSANTSENWPSLPLRDWEPTYATLHRFTQVVGKVRLALESPLNHWWHVPLYVTPRGLTTSSMPAGSLDLTMSFDFADHRLVAKTSDKHVASFELGPMSVARFYAKALGLLRDVGVPVSIWPVPVEVSDRTPFDADTHHAAYDPGAVERLHRILLSIDRVFDAHRGWFLGKSSPVHFFWGAFDLAVRRFSGRRNRNPPPDAVNGEAYSHEVISHGFWPGGDWLDKGRVDEAVFYAYAVPEPDGFRETRGLPNGARYDRALGEFLLPYDAVARTDDPAATLLDFMETTYRAGAERGGWDVGALEPARAERSPGTAASGALRTSP